MAGAVANLLTDRLAARVLVAAAIAAARARPDAGGQQNRTKEYENEADGQFEIIHIRLLESWVNKT
jgi:hypothetical protein